MCVRARVCIYIYDYMTTDTCVGVSCMFVCVCLEKVKIMSIHTCVLYKMCMYVCVCLERVNIMCVYIYMCALYKMEVI